MPTPRVDPNGSVKLKQLDSDDSDDVSSVSRDEGNYIYLQSFKS